MSGMRIGYACLALGVPDSTFRTCRASGATPAAITELIEQNLTVLENLITYNSRNNIRLFRITSDLIPFGSSPLNTLDWEHQFADRFAEIGKQITASGIRVSMHPGQYTVLNSPDEGVANRAVADLAYHAHVLELLETDVSSKIILHVGGAYGDKLGAGNRFVSRFKALPEYIRNRVVLENDERLFTISDVIDIASRAQMPVVFDNLHNAANPSVLDKTDAEWIDLCASTWSEVDGPQKMHYSQQDKTKKVGAHSPTINVETFVEDLTRIGTENLDIMLEVKDKNLSAIKCRLATARPGKIRDLEREWALYKYSVLEKSASHYNAIRELLKDKDTYPAVDFYTLVEKALALPEDRGAALNATSHVWGYVSDSVTLTEKTRMLGLLEGYAQGHGDLATVKRALHRLVKKYEQHYLLDSYFFVL